MLNKKILFCIYKIGRVITAYPSSIDSIHFNLNGMKFVTASNDDSVKICWFFSSKWLLSLSEHKYLVTYVEFEKNQNVISASRIDIRVILWSICADKSNCQYGLFKSGMIRTFIHQVDQLLMLVLKRNFFVLNTRSQRVIQSHVELHNESMTIMLFYLSDNLK
jgi:WD40 repeat protein